MSVGPLRFGAFKEDPARERAVARLQAWTRERFDLSDDAAVLVTELACTLPGCPPLETVIAFWPDDAQRRHFKVFKPLEEVVLDDLPPAWLKDALCSEQEDGFTCC
jgi:nitrate reductase delta subunit